VLANGIGYFNVTLAILIPNWTILMAYWTKSASKRLSCENDVNLAKSSRSFKSTAFYTLSTRNNRR
jgi:hypothetical protein